MPAFNYCRNSYSHYDFITKEHYNPKANVAIIVTKVKMWQGVKKGKLNDTLNACHKSTWKYNNGYDDANKG